MSSMWLRTSSPKNIFLHLSRKCRSLSTTPNDDGSKEFQIEVPWGHIAGKKWGAEGGKKVLAVHGWQDNAGSFDTLIPLLRKDLEVFAIDLPGHGRSSPYSNGISCYNAEYLGTIHRIVKALFSEKFIYLGHSLGSILGYLYIATFPELVDQYIALDNLKPIAISPTKLHKINKKSIEGILRVENRRLTTMKTYTEEAAAQKMVEGYFGSITLHSANILLKRGLKPSPTGEGFVFSRDPRVKLRALDFGSSTEALLEYGKSITCDVLHIKAIPGFFYEAPEIYQQAVEALRENAASLTYIEVEGTHHFHLNNPERVASYINSFISMMKKQ